MSTAVPYPNPPVRPEWLALHLEEPIDPGMPIIDPHHHFFDRHGIHATGAYLEDDFATDLDSGHDIVGTVYVQAGWRLRSSGPEALRAAGETEAAAGARSAAAGKARCFGIVSYADLRDPELGALLDAHEAAGAGHFRGIRQSAALNAQIRPMTTVVPSAGLLTDPSFQRGLRLLGQRGLTYDAWQYHPQLGELAKAARAAPQTRIVVDHLGGPLRCGGYRQQEQSTFDDWLSAMQVLAELPNVYVKVGGLGMTINGWDYHLAHAPPTSERLAADWQPWVQPVIDLFGANRCMFESNFPVDKGMFSYPVLWNAFKRLCASLSKDEQVDLLSGTAARVYRLAPS